MRARLILSVFLLSAAIPCAAADDGRRYYYEDIFDPFFTPDPDRPGYLTASRPKAKHVSFPVKKAENTFRVFVIGGSIAKAYMDRPESLAAGLKKALPSRRTEVLGCGMIGYDSNREALIEQEILEYSPDLIVLMTGHNEFLGDPPIPVWIVRAQERLARWSAFRKLVKRLKTMPWSINGDVQRLVARRETVFKNNLRKAITQAAARGVAVAVIVPPLNYREAPPVTPFYPESDPSLLAAWKNVLRGECKKALAGLADALADGKALGRDARTHSLYWMGRCHERMGHTKKALSHYDEAMLEALGQPRCTTRCMSIIRAIAKKEGAILIETDDDFLRKAAPSFPGLDMFEDKLHWRRDRDALVTAGIVEALSKDRRLKDLPWDTDALRALRRRGDAPAGKLSSEEILNTLGYAYNHMKGKEYLSWRAVVYLQAAKRLRPAWFDDEDSLLERIETHQGKAQGFGSGLSTGMGVLLRWHLGAVSLLEGDFDGAVERFTEVLGAESSPSRIKADLALARSLASR